MVEQSVFDLVAASGPYDEYAEKLMVQGQFVGSWDIDATWYDQDGGSRKGKGEWHFAWILGGRGIQDVLFTAGAPPPEFGTTVRCYDVALDAWHVTWMQPHSGEFVHLLFQEVGDRLVGDGISSDPTRRERWSFTDITADSFLWLGEVSFDGGVTWFLEQEMWAIRRTEPGR